ncbi:hypothetical protein M8C21_020300 [Ambrosia artemisiifolia]|uniref:Importin N-terminal domain-containing protein n=1 Tax=Ambrosia artemisiifolia TaxID=4212 RepID=A0AAD5CY72_AMBAR|nr:hypothetical protein M8C21_020300 [Ambrosia artemisiifolia]
MNHDSVYSKEKMVLKITRYLLDAQLANAEVRNEGKSALQRIQQENPPQFLLSLSYELSDERKPMATRRLAGILLMNLLDAKDATTNEHLWMSINASFRSHVKGNLLNTLGSSVPEAWHAAAQVIAKIASIEVPIKEWPQLTGSLLETAKAKEPDVKLAAFQCLVSIASSTYYHVLESHIETLFELTANAIKGDDEDVALQAIKFWCSVCDKELDLQASKIGVVCTHSRLIQRKLLSLVPMLLETLLKQQEDGIWNLAIVPIVMKSIDNNIKNYDCQLREAAIRALGSILEGPTFEKLRPTSMTDQNSRLKETTAWALGCIFKLLMKPGNWLPDISETKVEQIVNVLVESMYDSPDVAKEACGAFYCLVQSFKSFNFGSSVVTKRLSDIIYSLIQAAERTDVNIRSAAYETLNEVVICSNLAEESCEPVVSLLTSIMLKVRETTTSNDRENKGDLAMLWGVARVLIQKLSTTDFTKKRMLETEAFTMKELLKVLPCDSSTARGEAICAIGALASAIGPNFETHMLRFHKYLEAGLQNLEDYQLCSKSVGVVGDICQALGHKMLPYCKDIMRILYMDLSSDDLHLSLRPQIFSCFRDVALAIGEHFESYLVDAVEKMVLGTTDVCAQLDDSDEDMWEYDNLLKRSVFEACSCLLQALYDSLRSSQLVFPYAIKLLYLVDSVMSDDIQNYPEYIDHGSSVVTAAVKLVGDLVDAAC